MKLPNSITTDSNELVSAIPRSDGGIGLYVRDCDGDVSLIRLTKLEAVDLVDLIIRTVEP